MFYFYLVKMIIELEHQVGKHLREQLINQRSIKVNVPFIIIILSISRQNDNFMLYSVHTKKTKDWFLTFFYFA